MRIPWVILISALLSPTISQAGGKLPPILILFGASGSTQSGMDSCGYKSRNIPFAQGENKWPEIVREINANPDHEQEYWIAGHSTASVYAEHIARQLKKKNPKLLKNIKLILLDGFGDNEIQDDVETHCWLAKNSRTNAESLNSSSMKNKRDSACNRKKSHNHVYLTDRCTHNYCLHFTLVNKNVPSWVNGGNWSSQGYVDCKGNMDWVTKSLPRAQ